MHIRLPAAAPGGGSVSPATTTKAPSSSAMIVGPPRADRFFGPTEPAATGRATSRLRTAAVEDLVRRVIKAMAGPALRCAG
jgi:hypothetical protein